MNLNNLQSLKGIRGKAKRVGRGIGSGKGGHTVGFGTKGQKAHHGRNIPIGFEGGQTPIFRRMPKLGGFTNHSKKRIGVIAMGVLNIFPDGSIVTPQALEKQGVVRELPKHGVKILCTKHDKLTKKLTLKGFLYSSSAKAHLLKLGCTIQ